MKIKLAIAETEKKYMGKFIALLIGLVGKVGVYYFIYKIGGLNEKSAEFGRRTLQAFSDTKTKRRLKIMLLCFQSDLLAWH